MRRRSCALGGGEGRTANPATEAVQRHSSDRDTARGLVVNMSDVLFDTAKYSLWPPAREEVAKVAGIVSGHPGLRLDVEGHTDSIGGDDYNQRLSEQRGATVRDYLTQQGMPVSSVTAKGLGKTQPIASNDT